MSVGDQRHRINRQDSPQVRAVSDGGSEKIFVLALENIFVLPPRVRF
jgi:hypothetical protein